MDAHSAVAHLPELMLASVAATDTAVVLVDAIDPMRPIMWVNPAFERLSGFTAEQAVGQHAGLWKGPDTSMATVARIRAGLENGAPVQVRLLSYRPDGSSWWNEMHISPVRDGDGVLTHFIGVHHDVTAQVEMEQRAEHAATHDPLTGLVNRACFAAQLERELARGERDRRGVAVLFFDVDGFKKVNDDHGHAAGDVLLTEIGQRLTERLREEDLVARLGGDEFLALVVDLTDDADTAAAGVVADLAASLSRPYVIDGTTHEVRVSIGVALPAPDGSTAAELLAAADAAMYRDKPGQRLPGAPALASGRGPLASGRRRG